MKFYNVSFQYSESVYCANIAQAESLEDVERKYSEYSWYSISEASENDVELAKKKGMPIVICEHIKESNKVAALEKMVDIRNDVALHKARSAWNKGVVLYALDLLEELHAGMMDGYIDYDVLDSRKLLEKALLNGADSWRQFSEGGCAFCYDEDIAERLCTPSELKRTRHGELNPNRQECWLDVQTRALYQAARLIERYAAARR